jgi:hypothetical protein
MPKRTHALPSSHAKLVIADHLGFHRILSMAGVATVAADPQATAAITKAISNGLEIIGSPLQNAAPTKNQGANLNAV